MDEDTMMTPDADASNDEVTASEPMMGMYDATEEESESVEMQEETTEEEEPTE